MSLTNTVMIFFDDDGSENSCDRDSLKKTLDAVFEMLSRNIEIISDSIDVLNE